MLDVNLFFVEIINVKLDKLLEKFQCTLVKKLFQHFHPKMLFPNKKNIKSILIINLDFVFLPM